MPLTDSLVGCASLRARQIALAESGGGAGGTCWPGGILYTRCALCCRCAFELLTAVYGRADVTVDKRTVSSVVRQRFVVFIERNLF